MKRKVIVMGTWALAFIFAVNVHAASQNQRDGEGNNQSGGKNRIEMKYQVQEQNQDQNQEQNTSTLEREDRGQDATTTTEEEDQNREQERGDEGEINSEEHRSTVSDFVHGLLEIADKEEGIGQEVRTIAEEQNQSATTTIQAMEEVKSKSKIATFLFGSDYKNLGTLRSEVAQTQNRLEQLNKLSENVKNEADKTQLQNQVQALTQEQTKINNFIQAQESTFSLFGWLVKLFSK